MHVSPALGGAAANRIPLGSPGNNIQHATDRVLSMQPLRPHVHLRFTELTCGNVTSIMGRSMPAPALSGQASVAEESAWAAKDCLEVGTAFTSALL
jgi:hypothetical protein